MELKLYKIYKNKLYTAIRLDGHVINQEFPHTSYLMETFTLSPDNNIDNLISNTSLPCNFISTYNTLITPLFNFTYDPVDSNLDPPIYYKLSTSSNSEIHPMTHFLMDNHPHVFQ